MSELKKQKRNLGFPLTDLILKMRDERESLKLRIAELEAENAEQAATIERLTGAINSHKASFIAAGMAQGDEIDIVPEDRVLWASLEETP